MFKNISRQTLLLLPILILAQAIIKNNFAPIPDYNWDTFPYMALVLKMDGVKDDSIRHEKVYQIAKENMPWEHFYKNTRAENNYRFEMAQNFKGFDEQLVLYSIKPVYIGLVYLFYKSGMDLVKATYFPSLICYYLIGWLLFFFLSQRIQVVHALVTTIVFTLLPATLTVANLSSPDALSALFTLLALLVLVQNVHSRWTVLLCLLVILTRRDMILLVGVLYVGLIINAKMIGKNLARRIAEIVMLCIVFIIVGEVLNSASWKDTFVQSFIFRQVYFESEASIFLWSIYWELLGRIFIHLSNPFFLFILFGYPVFFYKKVRSTFVWKLSFNQFVFLSIIAVNLVRFFLFPDIHDRFYFVYYCMAVVLVVHELTEVKQLKRMS